ncbi:MAG TPA: GAF domain-containing sensor histidine kinase [Jatrophihabitans sp.]|jgi:signal transduction histidine kinase
MIRTAAAAEQERLAALAAYDVIGVEHGDPVVGDLRRLCEAAAVVADVPYAVVNLIDDRFQHQVAAFGATAADCRREESMCQTTLARGHDVYVPDASQDATFATSPWVDGRLGAIRAYSSTILRSPEGHAIGTLCVFDEAVKEIAPAHRRVLAVLGEQIVDVLELRLRSRQLQRASGELARSTDRLASLVGTVSHDLKAPITAILGFTELLADMDEIAADRSASDYVGRCRSAARRMLAMINDLLAYARVGAELALVRTPIEAMVAEIVSDLGAAAADATVRAHGVDVVADRTQLRALLQNLIGNAVTYRSERPCEVEVDSVRVGPDVVLRVVDNGSGIPADRREDVVRPMVRLRKEIPGSGIGLAVCTRIVAAHSGTMRIEDAPGGGTAVVVTLPATALAG